MTDKSESILQSVMKAKARAATAAKAGLEKEALNQKRAEEETNRAAKAQEGLGKRDSINGKEMFAKAFSSKKKLKHKDEFDVEKYAKITSDGSKLHKLVLEEGMIDNALSHFELECDSLKQHLTTEVKDSIRLKEEQAKQAEAAKKQAANKFLIVAKKSTLLDDDYDDIDDNQITALNNDVVFKDYNYKETITLKKQKFSYEGVQFEFTPRILDFSQLKTFEFPSLHDNLMEYLEKLTGEDAEKANNKTLGCLSLFRIICTYKDYFHIDPFCVDSYSFKKVCVLHAVNHILQSFEQPVPNNGFTSCRVVFVLPFRIDCVEIVEILADVLGEGEASSVEKFYETYASPEVGIFN